MIEQFNFDIRLIFAILNGKVSAAINRKLSRNFRQNGLEITPEQWTVLIFLWEKDGVTQQELCNATFKDKPSMTRLIDNMERQHLVVRISDKKDRRTNLIHLTKDGKELEELLGRCPLYQTLWTAHVGARNWAVTSGKKEGN